MGTEAERVNETIRGLLDYAQPASREIQEMNLNDCIRESYSLVSCQKEYRNVMPEFLLSDTLPPLNANEKQMRQMIVNLILNAHDAMPDGGTLTFTTGVQRKGTEDHICFTVSDTGEGIMPENRKKIFDPFFTTKEQGKGTGLGLSNVHRIVELSGGAISFSSERGNGTTFTILFPLTRT